MQTESRIWLSILFLLAVCSFSFNASALEILVVRVPIDTSWSECRGCRIESVALDRADQDPLVLTPQLIAARDPSVSFDGSAILFAGRKTESSHWQIWRMDRDGSNLVQITQGPGESFSPLWVGSLFHLNDSAPKWRIVYVSNDHGWIDESTNLPATALYASDPDGSYPLRITYNLLSDSAPTVLANGRVVFSSPSMSGDGSLRHGLLAVNIDGTDLMPFAAMHQDSGRKTMIRAGSHGKLYFIEGEKSTPLAGGRLAAVLLRRPLRGYQSMTKSTDGLFTSPLPMLNGELLVSHTTNEGDKPFAVYRSHPETGELTELVLSDDTNHLLAAAELTPRPVVNGRSSVVDLSQNSGTMFCLSAHISDRPEISSLETDSMQTLRVIEGIPRTSSSAPVDDDRRHGRRVLGEVPLESDGSFHIEVPSGTPLTFEIRNAGGKVVAQQDSWTWVMPREWRGCIGCHEDREISPPNVLAEAVVKPAVSLLPSHAEEKTP